MALIHSSGYKPRIFPINGDVTPSEIDRAQSIDPTVALNREEINEIGRENAVGYNQTSPTVTYRLTQYEYASIEFWQKIVNTASKGEVGQDEITLSDFKTPYFDIVGYLEDDDGTFKGTVQYPSLRTAGFSVTISDPQAVIERSFDFVGESAKIWQGDNKYFIYNRHEAQSGSDDEIDLSTKAPAENPNESGKYIERVVRVRSSVSTELEVTTDYTYDNGTKTLTILSIQSGDVIKTYYTSATAPDTIFTENDTDIPALLGDSVSIYLYIPASGKPGSSDYIYRLQSVTLDVAFDREDIREIGNKEVVARGVTNNTVTVTLGRILEEFTIEEIMAGQDPDYGLIDIEEFSDDVALIIKVFSDNTKSTFKYGFKATGLTTNEFRLGQTVQEYATSDDTLEGENLIITADSSKLGI